MEEMIDTTPVNSLEGYTEAPKRSKYNKPVSSVVKEELGSDFNSCLRNEIVKVQFVPRERTGITDTEHPFYGGLADGASITFVVPMLRNGSYKDPLTKEEKTFLEDYMSMEPNALSVHNRHNNFWDSFTVEVGKQGIVLDLSDPMNYIKYKVLLANNTLIAPSLDELRERPQETYRFVLVSESEVSSITSNKVSTKSKCWKEYGKVENNKDVLIAILESVSGRSVDPKSGLEFLQEKVTDYIEKDPKTFLNIISDPLLSVKVLIKKAVNSNVIERRGDYYYYNNNPLCLKNENPTISVAAKYLASAKNQEIKFSIESKLK